MAIATVPLAMIVKAGGVEVAKVEAEEVAKYKLPPAFLNVQ